MGRQKYSPEVKAACVADLRAGEAPAAVAERHNVAPATVRGWKSRLVSEQRVQTAADKERQEEVDRLVVDYLREGLNTLREQAKMFADPEWLKRQSAESIAILHGVLADKTVRLFEALAEPVGRAKE